MANLTYYVVDVFAPQKYTGNQLAVFTNAENLPPEKMQRFAKEINYSETTFITAPTARDGGYDVKIFTPEQELPFAGHPTLGTAYVLQNQVIKQQISQIILNLQVGQIPVTLHYDEGNVECLWMRQKTPTFHEQFTAATLAEVLSLDPDLIDSRFPIQAVSTGLAFIIVPVKTLAALKQIKLNRDKYFDLVNSTEAKCILAFCPETYHQENHLNVRVFVEYVGGPPEDPATGSGNGCLAGYLVEYSYFGKQEIDIRVEQGYEISRPSLLLLQAAKKEGVIEVNVGGKVILVAKGEFV